VRRGNEVSVLEHHERLDAPNASPPVPSLYPDPAQKCRRERVRLQTRGAITVTLDSVVGERPVAGSKMWLDEKSSLNFVS
jgi:hypothetical protein